MLIIYFYMVIVKKYKVKKIFFNKFPEVSGNFPRKFPEICEFTTLPVSYPASINGRILTKLITITH